MAVVRVKRRFNDEPVDALILACKKRKTEDEHLTSIFKFAATVKNQEENVTKHISKVFNSLESKESFKTPNLSNITEKLRAENKLFSQNSRLKVVNCFRALSESESVDESEGASASERRLTIVDIESLPITSSHSPQTVSSDSESDDKIQKYVYDIYYAPDCDLDEKILDNPISCLPLVDWVFEDCSNDVCEVEDESDNSNDENNWRNDYPDEDPDSIGEDDMKLACQMGGLNISEGEANSLSSDGAEEELVYGMDDPDFTQADVEHFGYSYASYKKKVANDFDSEASENSDFFYCDSDVEESDRS